MLSQVLKLPLSFTLRVDKDLDPAYEPNVYVYLPKELIYYGENTYSDPVSGVYGLCLLFANFSV